MQKNVFEKPVKIRYSEMDYNLVLKPYALLQFLQDLASDNAEQLDFGYSFIRKHNLAWFLLKYHIEFENYPANLYDIEIRTEPRGYNKLFAFRDFEIHGGGNLLGRAASTWSLVDLDTKNIVPVSQILNENPYMVPYEKREDDLTYGKIKPIQKVDIEKVFEIRFDDIDVNRHVNNSNYIVWAFEPLDYEFRSTKRLKTLDIVFKKEIKYGNKVVSQLEFDGDRTNHILKSFETGEDLCLISALWGKKI